ncbi:MAG: hypothetical protein WB507_00490 [Solirubrobacterales bacterium]
MSEKKQDNPNPRPQRGENGEKALREGALQEGLHLAPNQPPENSVLPPTNTGGEGQGSGAGGGGSSSGEE